MPAHRSLRLVSTVNDEATARAPLVSNCASETRCTIAGSDVSMAAVAGPATTRLWIPRSAVMSWSASSGMSGAAMAPGIGAVGAGGAAGAFFSGAGAAVGGGDPAGVAGVAGGDLPRAQAPGAAPSQSAAASTVTAGSLRPGRVIRLLPRSPARYTRPQRATKGDEAGSGRTGEALAKAFGYTMANFPSIT